MKLRKKRKSESWKAYLRWLRVCDLKKALIISAKSLCCSSQIPEHYFQKIWALDDRKTH